MAGQGPLQEISHETFIQIEKKLLGVLRQHWRSCDLRNFLLTTSQLEALIFFITNGNTQGKRKLQFFKSLDFVFI